MFGMGSRRYVLRRSGLTQYSPHEDGMSGTLASVVHGNASGLEGTSGSGSLTMDISEDEMVDTRVD